MASPPAAAQDWREVRRGASSFAVVFQHSHYLWGTAGNTFSRAADGSLKANGDGFTSVKRRTAWPLNKVAKVPARNAGKASSAMECWGVDAAFSATGGQHVCAGRFTVVPLGRVAIYSTNPATEEPLLEAFLQFRASRMSFMEYCIEWMMANMTRISPANPGPQP